jgi:hypothetical protein
MLSNKEMDSFRNKELYYEKLININLPSQLPNAIFNIKYPKYFVYKPENYDKNKAIFVMH